jgi:hypothetical protein
VPPSRLTSELLARAVIPNWSLRIPPSSAGRSDQDRGLRQAEYRVRTRRRGHASRKRSHPVRADMAPGRLRRIYRRRGITVMLTRRTHLAAGLRTNRSAARSLAPRGRSAVRCADRAPGRQGRAMPEKSTRRICVAGVRSRRSSRANVSGGALAPLSDSHKQRS